MNGFVVLFVVVLTAQECDWQDKLEKKLMRSTTLAADAEEISEELDVCASIINIAFVRGNVLKIIIFSSNPRIWKTT
jgi:hypothetical protein